MTEAEKVAAVLREESVRRVDDRYVHHAIIRDQMRKMADTIDRWERMEFTTEEQAMREMAQFLLTRIAEDEGVAVATRDSRDPLPWDEPNDGTGMVGPVDGPSGCASIVVSPARVLAECEAKRRIVARWAEADRMYGGDVGAYMDQVLRHLATVYADHPDYREEWRP